MRIKTLEKELNGLKNFSECKTRSSKNRRSIERLNIPTALLKGFKAKRIIFNNYSPKAK